MLELIYIYLFGVNVPVGDQWEIIPLIEMSQNGDLVLGDLFDQHNEHRILFPRIIMLTLAHITHYNTIAEMYFSWVIQLLIFAILVMMYKQSSGLSELSLLAFMPISWLVFSLRQFENILWGWQIQIYLCVLGFIFSVYMLERAEKIDAKFLLAIFGGILSTFSFVNGLLVWPTGLIFLYTTKANKRLKGFWLIFSISIYYLYFYNWVRPQYHPSPYYIIENPLKSFLYFVVNIGSPLGFTPEIAFAIGLILLVSAIIFFIILWHHGLLKENANWLSLIFFSFASSFAMTVGRAGFGVGQAFSSRYVTITLLGVIGLYLVIINNREKLSQVKPFNKATYLIVSKNKRLNQTSKAVLIGAVLAAILIILFIYLYLGFMIGISTKSSREDGAYYLETYMTQPDKNLTILYPSPDIVRERAPILENYKLSVFTLNRTDDINLAQHLILA